MIEPLCDSNSRKEICARELRAGLGSVAPASSRVSLLAAPGVPREKREIDDGLKKTGPAFNMAAPQGCEGG